MERPFNALGGRRDTLLNLANSRPICAAVAVAALTSGCAAQYQAPVGPDTAKLRFITTTSYPTVLYRIDTNRCPAKPQRQFVTSTLADPLFGESEVSPIEMTGTSGRRELNVRERVIPANAPFLFEVSARRKTYRTPGVTCLVAGAFVPHQSGEYELSHTMDDQGCQAQVFRISQEPDGNIRRTAEPTHRGVPALADLEYCRWREALAHGTTVLPDQDTAARMRLTIAPRIDVAPSTGTHEIAIPESRR